MATGMAPFVLDTLPGTLVANGLYFVKDPINSDRMELHVADKNALATRRVPTMQDIEDEIQAAIANVSSVDYQADIAARDAQSYGANSLVYVVDSTADTNVDTGGALYFYTKSNDTFTKVAEFESMDLVITWATLDGKPTSSVASIDDAVTKRHLHSNLADLEDLAITAEGALSVRGVIIDGKIPLTTPAEW